jgi:hypothetical protein
MSQETSISTPSSDTTDSISDDDDFPAFAELRLTPTEAFYNRNNQSMKCLVVLCEGLKDVDGDDLLDIRSSPFSSLKRGDIVKNVRTRGKSSGSTNPADADNGRFGNCNSRTTELQNRRRRHEL